MIRTAVALCERCIHNDLRTNAELHSIARENGQKPPKSIWCKVTDQPEDLRWEYCENWEEWR